MLWIISTLPVLTWRCSIGPTGCNAGESTVRSTQLSSPTTSIPDASHPLVRNNPTKKVSTVNTRTLSDLPVGFGSSASMATVLEPLTLCASRSSTLPSLTVSRITPSSIISLSGRHGLPQYRGLKLRPITATRFAQSATSSSRIASRGGRIVCEAQDTAVEGQIQFCLILFVW